MTFGYLKKLLVLTLSALLPLTIACSCSNSDNDGEIFENGASSSSSDTDSDVTVKTYEFPDFLVDSEGADVLSNVVYQSFDASALTSEIEVQPFDGYVCTQLFNESCYVYEREDYFGLLNFDGEEVISADGVTNITFVSDDLVQVKLESGGEAYYALDENGDVSEQEPEDFDEDRISFEKYESGEEDAQDYYLLEIDSQKVYDTQWTSFLKADISELNTSKACQTMFKASTGTRNYYILFDEYYNFTVYEAEYAFIRIKIGDDYGECYILDGDDYDELQTLISSFGTRSSRAAVSGDEDADYLQIEMGLNTNDVVTKTFSPDGYCYTEKTADDSTENKFFTIMDSETFVDLVNWIGLTIESELD